MDLKEALTFQNQSRHPWELARLQIIVEHMQVLLREKEGKSCNILDIGSGDMYVVFELAKKFPGHRFFAVDSNFTPEVTEAFYKHAAGLPVQMFASLDDMQKSFSGTADFITLFDVVEHIDDDKGFMTMLREKKLAGPDTTVFITVPAYQSLFCSHDRFLLHFRRHTVKGLNAMLSAAGYQKKYGGYFFFSLLLPRILTVIKEKIKKPKDENGTGLSAWKGSAFTTGFIRSVLIADYKVGRFFYHLGIRIPGLSIYFVCRPGV